MSFWGILGIVLGAIALIIALILMLPVHILIRADQNGVKLLYRILFLTFGKHPNPNSVLVRLAKELTGISRVSDLGKLKQSVGRAGVSATAAQIADILKQLLGRIVWILPRCRLNRLRLTAVCTGEDAAEVAMEYGAVCAVVYPLVGYLETLIPTRPRGEDIRVLCDLSQEESGFHADVKLSVRIFHVVRALLHIIRENVKNEVYREVNHES